MLLGVFKVEIVVSSERVWLRRFVSSLLSSEIISSSESRS